MSKKSKGGRPALPPEQKRVHQGYKIHPEVIAYLKATGNMSRTVEETLRESKGFKDWKGKQ